MPTLRIQRRLKSIRRFRHIAVVLAKYGFDQMLSRLHLPWHMRGIFTRPAERQATGPEKLILALEELGHTFIKFGQVLSTRSYLLPAEYAAALAKLQDHVRPFPGEEVRRTIVCELGAEPDRLFRSFEAEPFASALRGLGTLRGESFVFADSFLWLNRKIRN